MSSSEELIHFRGPIESLIVTVPILFLDVAQHDEFTLINKLNLIEIDETVFD